MAKEENNISYIDIPDILTNQLIRLCCMEVESGRADTPTNVRAFKICRDIFPPGMSVTDIKSLKKLILNDNSTVIIFYKLWMLLSELLYDIDPDYTVADYMNRRIKDTTNLYKDDPMMAKLEYLRAGDLVELFSQNTEVFVASVINSGTAIAEYILSVAKVKSE